MKIIFNADVRHVGKTPPWDMGVLSPHQRGDWAVRKGVESQFTFQVECSFSDGPPKSLAFSKLSGWAAVLWGQRKPVGGVEGSPVGQGRVETSLADV